MPLTFQELLLNKGNMPLETLLDACRHEPGSDCKLLFIRAATAAGLRQCRRQLWCPIQCALEGEDERCVPQHLPACEALCKSSELLLLMSVTLLPALLQDRHSSFRRAEPLASLIVLYQVTVAMPMLSLSLT